MCDAGLIECGTQLEDVDRTSGDGGEIRIGVVERRQRAIGRPASPVFTYVMGDRRLKRPLEAAALGLSARTDSHLRFPQVNPARMRGSMSGL